MEEQYNGQLCNERHNVINKRLDEHDVVIGELKDDNSVNKTELKNLYKRIDGLISAMWGLVLTAAGGIVTYIFNLISQKGGH